MVGQVVCTYVEGWTCMNAEKGRGLSGKLLLLGPKLALTLIHARRDHFTELLHFKFVILECKPFLTYFVLVCVSLQKT